MRGAGGGTSGAMLGLVVLGIGLVFLDQSGVRNFTALSRPRTQSSRRSVPRNDDGGLATEHNGLLVPCLDLVCCDKRERNPVPVAFFPTLFVYLTAFWRSLPQQNSKEYAIVF